MRRIKRNKLRFYILLVVVSFLLFGRIIFSLFVGFFEIQTVYIQADSRLILDTSIFQQKRNLLTISQSAFEKEVTDHFPQVASVRIEKHFPNTLFIQITPRVPIVYFKLNGEKRYIDVTGKILTSLPQYEKLKTTLLNCQFNELDAGQIVTDEIAKKAISVASNVVTEIDTAIVSIDCIDAQNAVLLRTSEVNVILPTDKNEELASSLQFLLKQFRIDGNWPKTLDLRFEKPVLISEVIQEASTSSDAAIIE